MLNAENNADIYEMNKLAHLTTVVNIFHFHWNGMRDTFYAAHVL